MLNDYKRITKVDTSKDDQIKQTDIKAILKQSAKELRTIKFITENIVEKGSKKSIALSIATKKQIQAYRVKKVEQVELKDQRKQGKITFVKKEVQEVE